MMELMMLSVWILSPLGLAILFGIPATAIYLARRPGLSAKRLAGGYGGALLVLALLCAAGSYVSYEEAFTKWHVPPERYWSAQFASFASLFSVAGFLSVLGISFVGVPALVALKSRAKATGPWLIVASILISVITAMLDLLVRGGEPDGHFLVFLAYLVALHGILACGFSLGSGLPWKRGAN